MFVFPASVTAKLDKWTWAVIKKGIFTFSPTVHSRGRETGKKNNSKREFLLPSHFSLSPDEDEGPKRVSSSLSPQFFSCCFPSNVKPACVVVVVMQGGNLALSDKLMKGEGARHALVLLLETISRGKHFLHIHHQQGTKKNVVIYVRNFSRGTNPLAICKSLPLPQNENKSTEREMRGT